MQLLRKLQFLRKYEYKIETLYSIPIQITVTKKSISTIVCILTNYTLLYVHNYMFHRKISTQVYLDTS